MFAWKEFNSGYGIAIVDVILERRLTMCRKVVLVLMILSIFLFIPAQNAEAFSYYNTRAFALGGAYTAIVDDYSAILYNPAGLAHTGWIGFGLGSSTGGKTDNVVEVISSVQNILADPTNLLEIEIEPASIEYGHFTGLRFGTLGAGISFKGKGSLEEKEFNLTNYNSFYIAYAYRVLEPFGNVGALSLGFNAKYIEGTHYQYYIEDSNNGPEVIGESTVLGNGFGLDFGAMVKLTDIINLGARIENLIKPFSLDGEADFIKRAERVYTVGAGVKLPIVGLTASTDLSSLPQGGIALRAGVEKRFLAGLFALRAGFAREGADARYYTGGLGLNVGPIRADLGIGFEDGNWDEPSAAFGLRANF